MQPAPAALQVFFVIAAAALALCAVGCTASTPHPATSAAGWQSR
jgi:hypothetical protein